MATELGMTEAALRKSIGRGMSGQQIPPLTRLGGRIVFVRAAVDAWYQALAERALEDAGLTSLGQAVSAQKLAHRPRKQAPTPSQRVSESERGWR